MLSIGCNLRPQLGAYAMTIAILAMCIPPGIVIGRAIARAVGVA